MAPDDSRASGNDNLQYDNEFWRFSLAVYAQDEVAQECLKLQKALGLDINLLLFCAWLGAREIVLSGAEIEAASRAVATWQEKVVRSLRGVRQQIKSLNRPHVENFRTKVKGIELEAEQIEQAMLFAYSKGLDRPRADRSDAITQNVKAYIDMKSGGALVRAPALSATCLIEAARRLGA